MAKPVGPGLGNVIAGGLTPPGEQDGLGSGLALGAVVLRGSKGVASGSLKGPERAGRVSSTAGFRADGPEGSSRQRTVAAAHQVLRAAPSPPAGGVSRSREVRQISSEEKELMERALVVVGALTLFAIAAGVAVGVHWWNAHHKY